MAIVTVMKANSDISLKSLYEKVSNCARRWTDDHLYPCNGAVSRALEDIEAQGFIKRRTYADDSISQISDLENMALQRTNPLKMTSLLMRHASCTFGRAYRRGG
jgi:hypothetical protein